MTRVHWMGGNKGGVGKSLTCIALVDWLRARGSDVLFVETDGNSDALLCCEKIVTAVGYDLDKRDGWNALGDLLEKQPRQTIVINSGARNIESVKDYGHVLNDLASAGVVDLTTIWPINRSPESIKALTAFRSAISQGRLVVIRNLFFGDAEKFTRWKASSFAQDGTRVGNLPELSDRIIDKIYARSPIEIIERDGTIVDRSNVNHWRSRVHAMFDELLK